MRNLSMRAFLAVALTVCGTASADAPIEQVSVTTFCSADQKYCARSTRDPSFTAVYAKGNPERVLWSMTEFVVKGFVSDDGRVVASCYAGLNLLPLDAKADFLVARLYEASGTAKDIRLGMMYPDLRALPRTNSHIEWGRCVGVDDDELVIERVDGTRWKSRVRR